MPIVFIHFGGATSPLPTLHCLPVSWFYMLLRLRPSESEQVAMETMQKDKVEERRERCLCTNGGREEACDAASLWLAVGIL